MKRVSSLVIKPDIWGLLTRADTQAVLDGNSSGRVVLAVLVRAVTHAVHEVGVATKTVVVAGA